MKNVFFKLETLFICLSICTLSVSVASIKHAKSQSPVRLIIDTDAGFDVDDIGAITVANALADLGEVDIIAISHTNGYVKGIGAVSTIMNYYGRSDVPLGAYKGEWAKNPRHGNHTADKYISDLTSNWPSHVKNSTQVLTSVEVYRKALAESPDNSVHIASIGITTNMRDLVLSAPDKYSNLTGHDLIARKVKLMYVHVYIYTCAFSPIFSQYVPIN